MSPSPPLTRRERAARARTAAPPSVVIEGSPDRAGVAAALATVIAWAEARRRRVALPAYWRPALEACSPAPSDPFLFESPDDLLSQETRADPGLIISLGGDGALLVAFGRYHELGYPFLSVNLGSVGFNAAATPDGLAETLEDWEAGRATEVPRLVLRAVHEGERRAVASTVALNDVVIHRSPQSRMLDLEATQGRQRVLAFPADGLLIATPTGSTAYNLSVGGPILHPALEAIVVTGLAPHVLTSRPIVLPAEPGLEVRFRRRHPEDAAVAHVDGQERWELQAGETLRIERHPRPCRLVAPAGGWYFQTLREKLNWCVPIRPASPTA